MKGLINLPNPNNPILPNVALNATFPLSVSDHLLISFKICLLYLKCFTPIFSKLEIDLAELYNILLNSLSDILFLVISSDITLFLYEP